MAELFRLRGNEMDFQLPQEFVLLSEVCAIQLFGRNLLECIPASSIILADCPSTHARMIEVLWKEKRYIVFQRDLEELAERRQPEQEYLPSSSLVALGKQSFSEVNFTS